MVARAPRKRMYRTMQGRMVDIEKLRAANESVQAVGNMNVNARGDKLGSGGKIVKTFDQIQKTHDTKIEVTEDLNFTEDDVPRYPYLLKSFTREGKIVEEWEHEDGSIEEREVE